MRDSENLGESIEASRAAADYALGRVLREAIQDQGRRIEERHALAGALQEINGFRRRVGLPLLTDLRELTSDTTRRMNEGVQLLRASELEPESVEWLEDGLVPLRVVTLVTGVDGVGKSTILYAKAARVTRGGLNGDLRGIGVDVVIASSEDHPNTVILPRLIAAGADLNRIHIIKVRRDGLDGEIHLPNDLPEVAECVRRVDARLLIIDPLVAYMPVSVDSHKAQHVRSVLAPIARLAEEQRLAVTAVVHFNGSMSTDVRARISGSKALRDAARSVLVCGSDPNDESRFLLVPDKNSFGPKPQSGRAYRIEGRQVTHRDKSYETSAVVWLGKVPITSRALLAGPSNQDATDLEIARDVILAALTEGNQSWKDLQVLCAAEGVSGSTARRARDSLKVEGGIDKYKDGAGPWLWQRTTKLRRPIDKFPGAQVQKPTPTRTNVPSHSELVHSEDSEQLPAKAGIVTPVEDPYALATEALADADLIACDVCGSRPDIVGRDGGPLCGAHR